MLELLKSLVFAVIMVPVVMAIILGAIYGGEVFNVFSNIGHRDRAKSSTDSPQNARLARAFCSSIFRHRRYDLKHPVIVPLDRYDLTLGYLRRCRYIIAYITKLTGATDGTYRVTLFAGATLALSLTGHALADEGKITVLRRRR